MSFKREGGDWTKYRDLENHWEINAYHNDGDEYPVKPYYERMEYVFSGAFKILEKAQNRGIDWVIFTHGHSTSRRGKTTARSQIRKAMRDKAATPYILRSQSIQHPSVFVARIRPKDGN